MADTQQIPGLASRFEIRKLSDNDVLWASAILSFTNCLYSPVWSVVYPDNQVKRVYDSTEATAFLLHQVGPELSYGVFDKEYDFKRSESKATGGKLYWDYSNLNATKEELLEQMDFPLVSVALSYDGFKELSLEQLKPLVDCKPLLGTLYAVLEVRDKRDPETWKAKNYGEVLLRCGTSTRVDYENRGIMKATAHFLMRDMAAKGFRAIQLGTSHSKVDHVWMNPPEPFKANRVSEIDPQTYEEEKDGVKYKPFAATQQMMTKIYLTLTPTE